MSKVLFISNYHELSGYSRGAQEYILSLDSVGTTVVPRRLNFGQTHCDIPSRILDLEKSETYDCKINIQYTLPHMFSYNGRYAKNIGMFATETSNFKTSVWNWRCNLMDEIWVINSDSKKSCEESGVKTPIKIAKHPIDIEKCSKEYTRLKFLENTDDFIFYTIGEFTKRKNIRALLNAFHSVFDIHDSVQLVIKTSIPGRNADEARQIILASIEEMLRGMKLKSRSMYKKIVIITEKLSEEDMMRLHHSGDCFVCSSYGEAWCIPAFEAWAMGKGVIAPSYGPFSDYMSNDDAWLVPCHTEPVFGAVETFGDLYTGNEKWNAIEHDDLCNAMREVFLNRIKLQEKSRLGKQKANSFSYPEIGKHLQGLLSGETV